MLRWFGLGSPARRARKIDIMHRPLLAILLVSAPAGQALLVSRQMPRIAHARPHAAATASRGSVPRLCDAPALPAEPADDAPSPLGRARAWLGKWTKFDKDMLKTLGVDAFFTCAPAARPRALQQVPCP